MTYDFILMNPPYNVGGKITKATLSSLSEDGKCVCLMPSNCYRQKHTDLGYCYSNLVGLSRADNEMFEDAKITKNLGIAILKRVSQNVFASYDDVEEFFFEEAFRPVYDSIKNTKEKYFDHLGNLSKKDGVTFDRNTTFIYIMRSAKNGVHTMGYDLAYNRTTEPVKDIPVLCNGQYQYFFLDMHTKKAKENITTFWYDGKLMNFLLFGLNKGGGTCEKAIPQIDWGTISDHPLWKQGDYDGAVLDVMGLEWADENHTAVKEKNNKTRNE